MHMYTGLLHAHSGLRYIVLLLIIVVIIQSLQGLLRQRKFSSTHKRVSALSMSVLHLQFFIGFVLFFISSKVVFDPELFGSTIIRFFTLEHPLLMLIAIVIITVGQIKSKAFSNYKSHKRLFWTNLIGLLLILASIPWPFRAQLGVGWF